LIHSRGDLSARLSKHSKGSTHFLACEKSEEGEENEAINIKIKNKIDKKTRLKIPPDVLEYLETRVMKRYTWTEIRDGKLFCQVNLTTTGVVKFKAGFRLIGVKV